jgi:hypothetical protein
LAAYESELISLVKAVCHWRPYLWPCKFIIRTDHFSQKYLLDQRLSMIPQHSWVSKLFGYQFSLSSNQGNRMRQPMPYLGATVLCPNWCPNTAGPISCWSVSVAWPTACSSRPKRVSKWFDDTSTGTATRAYRCGSLLVRAYVF